MRPNFRLFAWVLFTMLSSTTGFARMSSVTAPLVCSRGSGKEAFRALVTLPETRATGSRFTVRIDSLPSGEVSHFGLRYIFDMATDYRIPAGTKYVEGSARIVPNTGTANARKGARVWHDARRIHVLLPAHIENGHGYTPPSVEFDLEVTAAPGTELLLKLERASASAKVLMLGDIETTCLPEPAPYTIGKTRTVAAAASG